MSHAGKSNAPESTPAIEMAEDTHICITVFTEVEAAERRM